MILHRSMLKWFPSWRLRKLQKLYVRKRVGRSSLLLPLMGNIGITNLDFEYSWKTHVIAALADLEDGLFVDVGANVGQTLIDLKITHPDMSYLGFEPNVSCIAYLRELIAINQFSGCDILPVGLHEKHKILPLFREAARDADSCATMVPDLRPKMKVVIDYVPVFPMSSVRDAVDYHAIAFIKIDVEGAEDRVLFGMREDIEAFRPVILCEVLFTDKDADLSVAKSKNSEIIKFLSDRNYLVLQIIKSKNDDRVAELVQTDEFANEIWTQQNKDLCDYLFVPTERHKEVVGNLLSGSPS